MISTSTYRNIFYLIVIVIGHACSSPKYTRDTTTKASTSAPTTARQSKIVASAHQYVGSAYKYGGNGPQSFDCSGLVHKVFLTHNVQLPRTSAEQAKVGKSISLTQARPGDLLFFTKNKNSGGINHVALVVQVASGQIWVIHSTTSKGVIKEDIRRSTYWQDRLLSARRIE